MTYLALDIFAASDMLWLSLSSCYPRVPDLILRSIRSHWVRGCIAKFDRSAY